MTCLVEELAKIYQHVGIQVQNSLLPSLLRPKQKVILISGPTAVGKSDIALKVASAIEGEIISADSVQVYRGMDIGTAKPTPAERDSVPHHLIDICPVSRLFNVVEFYSEVHRICRELFLRNKIPIIVGGSGFYLHALIYGPPSGPPASSQIRLALEFEMDQLGAACLYARLQSCDPEYASTITSGDRKKIIRALEIIALTGRKVSSYPWKQREPSGEFNLCCWFLHRPRETLYRRIERRCDRMLEEGLLSEVRRLIEEGIESNPSASQAIGYKQAIAFLHSEQTAADYQTLVNEFKKSSRRYAKRQFTWFRQEPLFRPIDVELYEAETLVDLIAREARA